MPREIPSVEGKTIAHIIVPSGRRDDLTTIIRIEFTDGTFFELDVKGLPGLRPRN
jgi:hypothetical protein